MCPPTVVSVGAAFPVLSLSKGSRDSSFRKARSPPAAENPEKTIFYWIPDLDFVSSGMTFRAVSRLFQ